MPVSDYVRALRAKIGTDLLEVPTVSILTFDALDRVLLVRHIEGNDWTTPGGMIEPMETPSDAAVREMWEETGLFVTLTHVIGVFGGTLCASTYANGDRIAWVSTVFAATPRSGTLTPDGSETLEARYFARAEIGQLRTKPHLDRFLEVAWQRLPATYFQPPTWTPDVTYLLGGQRMRRMTSIPQAAAMLRNATADDAVKLSVLATHVWLDTYASNGVSAAIANYIHVEFAPERFRALVNRAGCTVHVAEVDGHLLGYAVVQDGSPCKAAPAHRTELRTLYIQNRFSGRGIGSALLDACGATTPAGRSALWVAVNTHNVRAINFYRKHGMVQIGTTFFELDAQKHENFVFAFPSG